jgi:phospholipid/cholesterol/gamma-HCH transport system substrate-binding protein
MFYPGLGDERIPEGSPIPSVNSSEGKRLMAMGLGARPEQSDSISDIAQRAGLMLGTLNALFSDVQEALEGTDRTSLGRTMKEVEMTVSGLQTVTERLPNDIEESLGRIMAQLDPLLANLNVISAELADPDGAVMSVLNTDGEVYANLVASLESVSATLRNLERTSDFVPTQLPQLAAIITDLHTTLPTAENVLIALTNNPLLRRGIPTQTETKTGGRVTRDVEF